MDRLLVSDRKKRVFTVSANCQPGRLKQRGGGRVQAEKIAGVMETWTGQVEGAMEAKGKKARTHQKMLDVRHSERGSWATEDEEGRRQAQEMGPV